MRTTIKKLWGLRLRTGGAAILAAVAGMTLAAPASAQYDDESWEWEPGTGYHEEEWYDPGDWFDDDYYGGVDYEETGWYGDDDYYDYYEDDDYYAGYDYYDDMYDGYDYGDDYYDEDEVTSVDWDYYTDEDDPADDDYWDSRRDFDSTNRANTRRDRMSDSAYVYRNNRSDSRAMSEQRQSMRSNQNRRSSQGMRTAQLRGELEAWQRKNIQGQRDAHTLVRMTTEDGRSAVVNLGPNVDLRRLNLDDDDEIAVRGVRGSIDGRPVLMAHRIRIDDKTIRMNNWQPNQASSQRDRDQRGMRAAQLRGELEGWQRKNIQGQRDAHTLVRLRTEDGRSAIVNLGPNVDLSRLNLEEDDRIAVFGQRGTIDGRPVLMAQRVKVGDRTIRMNNWQPQTRR